MNDFESLKMFMHQMLADDPEELKEIKDLEQEYLKDKDFKKFKEKTFGILSNVAYHEVFGNEN